MAEAKEDYSGQIFFDLNSKIRDIEEKQKILRDRLLLIGQNMIDIKENTNQKILEIKKDIEKLQQETSKMSSFLETVSGELSKFARKEDLEILAKQAKMFQPMEFATKKDIEELRRSSS